MGSPAIRRCRAMFPQDEFRKACDFGENQVEWVAGGVRGFRRGLITRERIDRLARLGRGGALPKQGTTKLPLLANDESNSVLPDSVGKLPHACGAKLSGEPSFSRA